MKSLGLFLINRTERSPNMSKSREEEIMELIRAARAEENMPEGQTGNDSDYDARQDILDWIESQGIYIRE